MHEGDNFEVEYDQLNPEKEKKTDKIKHGLKFARVILLTVMVISLLILLFINRDKINIDNFRRLAAKIDIGITSSEKENDSIIEYDYDSTAITEVYKDGIARLTSDELIIMDSIGNQFQSVLTGFNNPAIAATNKYVLAYDRGGRRLIITNSFAVVFEKTFDENIVHVSINDNGYFSVVTESEAYKNKIYVFNSDFKEIYIVNSLNKYIVCTDISNDNKHIAVSSLYVKNENVLPQINYYKFTSENSMWDVSFDENVAVDIKIRDNGDVVALFEWGICTFDSKGKEKFRYKFENKILQAYDISNDRCNVVLISDSVSGDSQIYAFNDNGKKLLDLQTDYSFKSVDTYSDNIAVLSSDKLYVYNLSGKCIAEKDNINDGEKVIFSNRKSVVSVGTANSVYNIIK